VVYECTIQTCNEIMRELIFKNSLGYGKLRNLRSDGGNLEAHGNCYAVSFIQHAFLLPPLNQHRVYFYKEWTSPFSAFTPLNEYELLDEGASLVREMRGANGSALAHVLQLEGVSRDSMDSDSLSEK
jgi:hypothetical protein